MEFSLLLCIVFVLLLFSPHGHCPGRENGVIEGVLSQTLQESGPGTVKPSESLRLTCTYSGFDITGSYSIHWVRQNPGKKLEWIGGIGAITLISSSLTNRVSLSKDNGKKQVYLQMNGMGN
ncbi:hypothetical protein XELAEV_18007133mg [Xenopus laevis]|uniref:Immunoglobulin V-set domain-containing protein n=1 Tax=Xenopus laevis TaxID=8355 RepID=A0A974I4E7_XENLA|nr:hypothetical protein XELAEV_18007133mg [Xenopus laevis]